MTPKPPVELDLMWDRELIFHGRSGDATIVLDSAGKAGPSPVQTLAFALAGCMGMDVVHILLKARQQLRALTVHMVAERAPEDPHRVTAVTLEFVVTGAIPEPQIQRAVTLSHDKYCSVWHSLRQDIRLDTRIRVQA